MTRRPPVGMPSPVPSGARPWLGAAACGALLLAACGQEDSTTPPANDSPPEPEVTCPSIGPRLDVTYPADGAPHTERFIEIQGTATDADRVQVTVDGGEPLIAAGETIWRTTVQLTPGPHTIVATPLGRDGCPDGAAVERVVVQGEKVTLVEPPPSGEVELRLDKLALGELLTPADQACIVLTTLDLGPLVENALKALADPEAWWGGDPGWGPVETSLASLLVMSPDTADLAGTQLDAVMDLSRRLGLAPGRILADLLGLAPTAPFLASDVVAGVMIDLLIASHPNFEPTFDDCASRPAVPQGPGEMVVTLADGLADLAPLGEKYGRVERDGALVHPGFLAEAPTAALFTPAFAMVVRGSGNVSVRPGLRPGEGFASHVVPPPAGTPILDLDFSDPDTFTIVGLEPEPTAALTLGVLEHPFFVPLASADAPRGGPVWDVPQWTLEHIVAEASFRGFSPLWPGGQTFAYDLGSITDAAVVTWDEGEVVVDVVADLGPPPPTAYIWDLIVDVAQARLHDDGMGGTLGEGEANVRLALPPLPIGLDAAQLVEAMRPALEAQKQTLIGMMVGDPSALPSEATIWLTDGPGLAVSETAPALYPSRAQLAEGSGGVYAVSLGAEPQRFWTESAAGEVVVLDIGPWEGTQVVIGQTVMPEAP